MKRKPLWVCSLRGSLWVIEITSSLTFALVSPPTADSARFESSRRTLTESPYLCLSYIDSEVSTGRSFRDHLVLPLYFSDEETGPGREVL